MSTVDRNSTHHDHVRAHLTAAHGHALAHRKHLAKLAESAAAEHRDEMARRAAERAAAAPDAGPTPQHPQPPTDGP